MKVSNLLLLTLWISLFSQAEMVIETNKVFIEPNKVSSWNHIGGKYDVYAGLSQAVHKYQLNKQLTSSPSTTIYELTLVKKLLDWDQQHSNGFEVSLHNLDLHVEQLNQLHFKIKLSPLGSVINSTLKALSEKNTWMENPQNYTELLSEQAHFTLIFYGKNNNDAKQRTLHGAYSFTLKSDSKQRWKSVNISPENINYYWQKNYQQEPASITDIKAQTWQGFILVAESGNTKVVRNYIPASFPKKYTEVFNELDIALTDLQITLK